MLKIIYYILTTLINVYGIYFIITALTIFKKNKIENKKIDKINYFSILIPARNEEKVIKNLIESLNNLDYNKNKYEINVVINNSTDNTENIVKSTKANIIKCKRKIHNKADALKEIFDLQDYRKDIDAYIIFDADNVVDKNFLKYMNESLNNGYEVAQGFRDTKNIKCNWISASYTMYYYIQNAFFNKARKLVNKSASLNGTGFMIKKDVIDRLGFNTKTISEDIEFTGICALNNIKIDFVENAITYDEQASKFKVSWTQRKRWSKGCLECFKVYAKKLIQNFKFSNIDMLFVYMAPLIQILTLITTIIKLNEINIITFITFIMTYIIQIIICLFSCIYFKKSIKKYYKGILLFPIFLISWIPINIMILFKKNLKWSQIEHNNIISINEIHN